VKPDAQRAANAALYAWSCLHLLGSVRDLNQHQLFIKAAAEAVLRDWEFAHTAAGNYYKADASYAVDLIFDEIRELDDLDRARRQVHALIGGSPCLE
jgi:hypothetical protein